MTIPITAEPPTHPGAAARLAPEHVGNGPRQLATPAQLRDEALGAMRYLSPLRYPGAKSGLAKVIASLVTESSKSLGRLQLFVEPFAGGASTALHLAGAKIVDRILLADADPLVTMFWQVAATDTEWLIERMWEEPVTLERWDYWRRWTPACASDREIAVKCLFLNRTTFSGILHGGPARSAAADRTVRIRSTAVSTRPGWKPACASSETCMQPIGSLTCGVRTGRPPCRTLLNGIPS